LERTLCLLLRERGRNKLRAIDDALERIREGTFGVCEDCGEKIPVGRLEVMHFATTCRDCQTLREKRDKLFSDNDESGFSYD
jgi:DnaK suppressor protein